MTDITRLPDNFIGKEDKERLASFGGHTIAHGRATRWHWDRDHNGDDVFEIFTGGVDEVLALRVHRDREQDAFCAHDAENNLIGTGELDHVMAEMEQYFIRLHGEPDAPA